jgi:hypothetical protein
VKQDHWLQLDAVSGHCTQPELERHADTPQPHTRLFPVHPAVALPSPILLRSPTLHTHLPKLRRVKAALGPWETTHRGRGGYSTRDDVRVGAAQPSRQDPAIGPTKSNDGAAGDCLGGKGRGGVVPCTRQPGYHAAVLAYTQPNRQCAGSMPCCRSSAGSQVCQAKTKRPPVLSAPGLSQIGQQRSIVRHGLTRGEVRRVDRPAVRAKGLRLAIVTVLQSKARV